MDNQIRVNMTPNHLDLKTLHCSQGDTEAREWEFELHNNGELIDTSDVSEQMFFKAYKGGTEQILPENTSTPTTSPFLGDIRYPQGLLTDQEFTYRQSPTEEDGLAKITDIKGNTLVWNQLVPISTRATTTTSEITFTNNNDGSVKASGTASATAIFNYANANAINIKSGHKYLLKGCPSGGGDSSYQISLRASNGSTIIGNDTGSGILLTASSDYTNCALYLRVVSGATINGTYIPQLFDLTQMGLNISSPSEFTSLFSLPYYDYNQGSLLSFNGNGIKTVGFNQWDEEWEVGAYNSADGTKADNVRDRIRNKNPIRVFPSVNYYKNKGLQVYYVYYYDASMNFIGWNSLANQGIFTPPSNACYMNFNGLANTGTTYNNDICINISDANKNGTYEPYTSSTLSLPISTYFPTGMKSAGNVYDELTESKAITRIGKVTFDGTQTIVLADFSSKAKTYFDVPDIQTISTSSVVIDEGLISNYLMPSSNSKTNEGESGIHRRVGGQTQICVSLGTASGITSIEAWNAYLSAHPLTVYYPLATPTETSFTTASLVTENAEIPLSNNDGVLIGKCTEELSAEPGFHDAKIKLSDSDGECYSNKLQLHVERSPQ